MERSLDLPVCAFTGGTDALTQLKMNYQIHEKGLLESLWNDPNIENLGDLSNYGSSNTLMINQSPESSHRSLTSPEQAALIVMV